MQDTAASTGQANIATLAVTGTNVPLKTFASSVDHFEGLVQSLSASFDLKNTGEWQIEELLHTEDSFEMTCVGVALEAGGQDKIRRVVQSFLDVGKALQDDRRLAYSDNIIKEATAIKHLLNGRIRAIRFQTPEDDATVIGTGTKPTIPPSVWHTFGAIRGRIQTVTNRRSYRFTLYDAMFDQPVTCYLDNDQELLMRGLWGRRSIVEGWISRDPVSGRAVAIRRISDIDVLDDVMPGGYTAARGILPRGSDDETPEAAIRRIRDAG